jgi:hypothetical protein
MTTLRG